MSIIVCKYFHVMIMPKLSDWTSNIGIEVWTIYSVAITQLNPRVSLFMAWHKPAARAARLLVTKLSLQCLHDM